jgi:hypothetical protein
VAWVLAVPALLQAGPERPSHADVPSRADIVSSQGLVPLEGFAWHGCSRCLLYFKRAPSDLLTPMSLRGLTSSRARGSCRSRVLRGMGARGACFINAGPGRPSHADVPSRVDFTLSQGLAPLEGSPCFARDPVIKCPAVEAAVSQRGRAFLGVVAWQADVTACLGPC